MKSLKDIKIKELIFHNFVLKILAVIVAVILWIIVVNIDDPSIRKPISGIQVELQNEAELVSKGYTYQVKDGATASIVIRGPQSIVEDLKASDFHAYADLSERSPESDTAKIVVSCIKEDVASKIDIVTQKTEYVQLSIDNKLTKEFSVNVNTIGNPASGYVTGEIGCSPTTIKVSGAESTVQKISSVGVDYDISGMTVNVNDTAKPIFYDENGKKIDTSMLELSRENIQINIVILPTKWIPVNYAVSGTVADGYQLIDTKTDVEKVQIAGTKDDLASISGIDIPAGIIDVDGATETKEFEIALATYLSGNFHIVSASNKMKVTASIEQIVEKEFSLTEKDITVNGLKTGLTAKIDASDLPLIVKISGVGDTVNKLTISDLSASIDLTDRNAGNNTARVSFKSNEEYKVSGTYTVKVVITEKETGTTGNEESSNN